jgi:16S rRNA (cytosine1402-N4)-methyltransferase
MSDYHVPVLLKESVDALIIDNDGVYVDVTYGGGGHSQEILKRLSPKGRLIVFDQDGEAEENTLKDERLIFVKANFRHIYRYWRWLDVPKVSGILADLGVSSHQFDVDYRGFSYRFEADLDMRMNEKSALTAALVLNNYEEKDLVSVFSEYGEVRNSKKLARVICDERQQGGIRTTQDLNMILDSVVIGERSKYFSQVYQALRIEVNDEMGSLKEMLEGALRILETHSRLVIISYHSLEDRLAKRFIRSGRVDGVAPKDDFGRSLAEMKNVGKMILPNEEEQKINSRSRSAKMRIGEKI